MDSIVKSIAEAIGAVGSGPPVHVVLNRPDERFGDYATSAALSIAQTAKQDPHKVAQQIADILTQSKQFASVKVAGTGFINLTMSKQWLEGQLDKRNAIRPLLKGKRYIIEYSSPNIAKPMHVGHLRTTILGQVLVNLYRALGAEVIAWSHPGDFGVQFGKLIVGWQKWGDAKALESNPIEELLRVYVKFHKEARDNPNLEEEGKVAFKSLQDGDENLKKLWREFSSLSQKEFDRMYALLRVRFDVWKGESSYNALLHDLVQRALGAGVAKESDGAVIIPLDEQGLPPFMIQKSDGATLYATADLVMVGERARQYSLDEIIIVVGNEQSLHFRQLFAAARKLADAGVYGAGFVLPKQTHVSYGFFRLAHGKISTREGELIRLEDVVRQAIAKARQIVRAKSPTLADDEADQLAGELGVAAVKYTDLAHDRHTDVVFDWDKMFSYEGNSIVYLLYTFARCNSLLKESQRQSLPKEKLSLKSAWTVHEKRVLLTALTLNDQIQKSVEHYDPHFILTYAYTLASHFSRFYNTDPILRSDPPVRERRLKLVRLVKDQLQFLFDLLDIIPPQRL